MESLAKLVVLLFISIYCIFFVIELFVLKFCLNYLLPRYEGWWYCLWIPILILVNWLLTTLAFIILSKIGSKE